MSLTLLAIAVVVALPLLFLLVDLARGRRPRDLGAGPDSGRSPAGDVAAHAEDLAYRRAARAIQR